MTTHDYLIFEDRLRAAIRRALGTNRLGEPTLAYDWQVDRVYAEVLAELGNHAPHLAIAFNDLDLSTLDLRPSRFLVNLPAPTFAHTGPRALPDGSIVVHLPPHGALVRHRHLWQWQERTQPGWAHPTYRCAFRYLDGLMCDVIVHLTGMSTFPDWGERFVNGPSPYMERPDGRPTDIDPPSPPDAVLKGQPVPGWNAPYPPKDQRPHSRACGIKIHEHGPACTPDCPTCQPDDLFKTRLPTNAVAKAVAASPRRTDGPGWSITVYGLPGEQQLGVAHLHRWGSDPDLGCLWIDPDGERCATPRPSTTNMSPATLQATTWWSLERVIPVSSVEQTTEQS